MKIGLTTFGAAFVFLGAILQARGGDRGPTVLAKGLFSYQAPPGWQTSTAPVSPYPVSSEGWYQPHEATIMVEIEDAPGGVSPYISRCLQALRAGPAHARVLDRRPFVTAAGLDGIRAVMTIHNRQQILYFFDGGSGKIIVVNASCPLRDAGRDTPLFDASLKTFSLE